MFLGLDAGRLRHLIRQIGAGLNAAKHSGHVRTDGAAVPVARRTPSSNVHSR